jgi:hypothetical protein
LTSFDLIRRRWTRIDRSARTPLAPLLSLLTLVRTKDLQIADFL